MVPPLRRRSRPRPCSSPELLLVVVAHPSPRVHLRTLRIASAAGSTAPRPPRPGQARPRSARPARSRPQLLPRPVVRPAHFPAAAPTATAVLGAPPRVCRCARAAHLCVFPCSNQGICVHIRPPASNSSAPTARARASSGKSPAAAPSPAHGNLRAARVRAPALISAHLRPLLVLAVRASTRGLQLGRAPGCVRNRARAQPPRQACSYAVSPPARARCSPAPAVCRVRRGCGSLQLPRPRAIPRQAAACHAPAASESPATELPAASSGHRPARTGPRRLDERTPWGIFFLALTRLPGRPPCWDGCGLLPRAARLAASLPLAWVGRFVCRSREPAAV
jgi:hypothetical protein